MLFTCKHSYSCAYPAPVPLGGGTALLLAPQCGISTCLPCPWATTWWYGRGCSHTRCVPAPPCGGTALHFAHLQYFNTSTGCVVGKLVHPLVLAPTCGITGRPICMSALCQAQCHSGAAHLFTTCSISQGHTGWCCFTCLQAYGVAASGSMNTLVHTYAVSNCCQVAVWALTPHGSIGLLVSATVCLSGSMWQQGHALWRLLYARITM